MNINIEYDLEEIPDLNRVLNIIIDSMYRKHISQDIIVTVTRKDKMGGNNDKPKRDL